MNPDLSPRTAYTATVLSQMPYMYDEPHVPQSPFAPPRQSTPHPHLGTRENPINIVDESDSSDSILDDYESAWMCYRTYYIKEQRHMRQIAQYFWDQLSLSQRQSLLGSYSRIVDQMTKEFTVQKGICKMHCRGWSHITIKSEDLHQSKL